MVVLKGESLKQKVDEVIKQYPNKRACIYELQDFLINDKKSNGKVAIVCGLINTGKTTLMMQAIHYLCNAGQETAAYIEVQDEDSFFQLNEEIQMLKQERYRYLFINEVTKLENFLSMCDLFADVYAVSGLKIVLSGSNSLVFHKAIGTRLYNKAIMIHTTFIPFSDYRTIFPDTTLVSYVKHGGVPNTMSTDEYVQAIVDNIQVSLEQAHEMIDTSYGALQSYYLKGKLKEALKTGIQLKGVDIAKRVVEKMFDSNEIGQHQYNEITKVLDNIKDNIQNKAFEISELAEKQIERYLVDLDIMDEIDVRTISEEKYCKNIIVQPGIQYTLVQNSVESLKDKIETELCKNIMHNTEKKILEEIVVYNMRKILDEEQYDVYRLLDDRENFREIDLVVEDKKYKIIDMYEVQYSQDEHGEQKVSQLNDEKYKVHFEKEHSLKIRSKNIIYCGETPKSPTQNVQYINCSHFLENIQFLYK